MKSTFSVTGVAPSVCGAKQRLLFNDNRFIHAIEALPRSVRVAALLVGMGLLGDGAWAGTVTECTQANLEAALAGGGMVSFACSGTITLTNPISITQNTTLDAAGNAVIISGGNLVRLFQVGKDVVFRVDGLTLANGLALGVGATTTNAAGEAIGGGILNAGGTVVLTDCLLRGHVAKGGDGGAVFTDGAGGMGGAIGNLGGGVSLTNCMLLGNTAQGGKAPVGLSGTAGQALGGAIYSSNGIVTLQTTTFSTNASLGGEGIINLPSQTGTTGGAAFGGAVFGVSSPVTIHGSTFAGNQVVGGGGQYGGAGFGGALFLPEGSEAAVRLSMFSSNSATGGNGFRYFSAGAARGGAAYAKGELRVYDTTFQGHSAVGGICVAPGLGQGGAVYSEFSLTLVGCTLYENWVQSGGFTSETPRSFEGIPSEGGAVWSSGRLTATNCTWNANRSTGGSSGGAGWSGSVGGAGRGGAICLTNATAVLAQVTIAANHAEGGVSPYPSYPAPGPAQGGGLFVTNATVTVRNSILASSTSGGEVSGTLVDGGYNICSDATACLSAPGSLNNTDPKLAALSNNGGPTKTLALLAGSPARDSIPSGFPAVDQRGITRPQGSAADCGAYEAENTALAPTLVVTRSGENLVIGFAAEAGRTYRLLASPDLSTWTSVDTNSTSVAGLLQFVRSTAGSSRLFYRVVTP